MNIAHLNTEKGWRGGENQVYMLHKGLVELGINSVVFCRKDAPLEDKLKEEKLPCVSLKFKSQFDLSSANKIAKECKKYKIDVLHLHSSHALMLGHMVKWFIPNIKLVLTRRVGIPLKNNVITNYKYRSTALDKIVCISKGVSDVLEQSKLVDIEIIHSRIDIHKFENSKAISKEKIGIPNDSFVLGIVGAFTWGKGYDTLIEIMCGLKDKYSNIHLVSLGDGKLFDKIKVEITKRGLQKNFHLLGHKNNVGDYLKMFDVFILPAKSEGLGTSILDAQSVSLPVIASNVGGIPEIVKHNSNGLLIESGDYKGFTDAIIELYSDEKLRNRLSEQGVKDVVKFHYKEMAREYDELYKRL
ncbi:MAG: glycosyltransferase family 4 protein [Flavobacteriaceae bacterium]|nr:glycosyltransferase family 4 protein [Flavobacteriaceae bacterium]